MSEYNEGDRVLAVKDDTEIRAYLRAGWEPGQMKLRVGTGSEVDWYTSHGWTITVIEKAAPKIELPTEEGWYTDQMNDIWIRTSAGNFECLTQGSGSWRSNDDDTWAAGRKFEQYAPFTRLEPRADTAKAVLQRVMVVLGADGITKLPNGFSGLANEFGVKP